MPYPPETLGVIHRLQGGGSSKVCLSVALQDTISRSARRSSAKGDKEETYAFVDANGRPAAKRGAVVDAVVPDLVTRAAAIAIEDAVLASVHTDRGDGQVAASALARRTLAGVVSAADTGHVLAEGHASGRAAASENAVAESVVARRGVGIANDWSSVS